MPDNRWSFSRRPKTETPNDHQRDTLVRPWIHRQSSNSLQVTPSPCDSSNYSRQIRQTNIMYIYTMYASFNVIIPTRPYQSNSPGVYWHSRQQTNGVQTHGIIEFLWNNKSIFYESVPTDWYIMASPKAITVFSVWRFQTKIRNGV